MVERVGKYRLVERIGEGGMGEVYRARLESTTGFARDVALKLIRRDVATDPRMRELFLREGRALAAVRHRGVVQVLELDSEGDRLFLAMEYLDGVDLRRLLTAHGGRLPWATAAFIASEVALALGAAHALGLVHRDLSPSNVMVCRDGAVKVLDFGLAKPAQAEQSVSGLQGKVHYAAPEVIVGTTVDHRADLYSLGVVLYEAVAGRQPFGGATDFDTMNQVLRAEVPPPASGSQELDALILKALARDRAARFQDGDVLARALSQVVGDRCRAADLPALLPAPAKPAEPVSMPAEVSKPPSRRGLVLAIAGGALLLAAGGGALLVTRPEPAPVEPPVVVTPPPPPAAAPTGVLIVTVDRGDAQIEVDGRVLATNAARAQVELTAGAPHEVTVTAPGVKAFKRSVTVGEGGTIEVAATLKPPPPPRRPVRSDDDDAPINPLARPKRK
ncbi:MAG: serine/threonine protein kinase [Myxococcaceae bacterium]|nr:serine/threonine protein kinase [Myxococcaceae bacterium]